MRASEAEPDWALTGQAAAYVADQLGPVFPLDNPELPKCAGLHGPKNPCDDKRGKHPAAKWSTAATTDAEEVRRMFNGPPRNIGLACGPAGLLVVDEDRPSAFEAYAQSIGETVPPTFTVRTGRGRHFYFRQDGSLGNKEGALTGRGINLRGAGGYVVAPGSRHESGARAGSGPRSPPAVVRHR